MGGNRSGARSGRGRIWREPQLPHPPPSLIVRLLCPCLPERHSYESKSPRRSNGMDAQIHSYGCTSLHLRKPKCAIMKTKIRTY